MDNISEIYALIGPAGVALIFVGLFAIYLSVWLIIYLTNVWRHFRRDFLDLEHGKDRCLRNIDRKNANPLIRIIYDIVVTHGSHSDDIRAEVAYLFHRNFKRVTNCLCWLRLISVVSPLLGLLGTVFGMVAVFQSLSSKRVAGNGDSIEAVEHSYRALEVCQHLKKPAKPGVSDDEEKGGL